MEITLIGIDCIKPAELLRTLNHCTEKMQFKDVKLLTDKDIKTDIEVIKINKINSLAEYNQFVIKELYKYIDTEFMLIVQSDGFILNEKSWSDEYLNYDYIGAYWNDLILPLIQNDYPGIEIKNRVGNGGFSLRSKKLMEFISTDEFIQELYYGLNKPEDTFICCYLYDYLISNGFKFAPKEIADKFSIEYGVWNGSFGFHSFYTDLSNYIKF